MSKRGTRTRAGSFLGAVVAVLALAACGSTSGGSGAGGSGNVHTVLQQTFSNGHRIQSGVVAFTVTIDPSGSTTLTTPVSLSLSGPFQSRGSHQIPASNFTLDMSALGHHGTLGVISTGTHGYVTLDGSAYRLPQSSFQSLESRLAGSGSSASGPGLAALGLDPRHWLKTPVIAGSQPVDGTPTTHISAGVDVAALLTDLDAYLARTAKGATGTSQVPSSIPPATRQKIVASVQHPTIDIWTGARDRILRRMSLALTVPVTGNTSTQLGGLRSAAMGLVVQYSHLNQPQTVVAPTHVLPYSQFQSKLQSALQGLSGLTGGVTGGTGASPATVTKYSKCIQAAGQDVARMQRCSALLNQK